MTNSTDVENACDDLSEHMIPTISNASRVFNKLHECYILHFQKNLIEFSSVYNALIRVAELPKYQSKVTEYIKEIKRRNEECMSAEEYSEYVKSLKPLEDFLQNPLNFDIEKETYEIFSEEILNYEKKWETVIAGLKQKAAIKKRREYIDSNINEIMPIISRYNDLVAILTTYQQKNKSLI